jgi:CheY-like chemotaxis protein
VLLVEDHPDTAYMLARLLRAKRYDVKTAGSVADALELAAAENFDILVSDLGLPDGTGYELMEQIRERYGMRGIALSGFGMEEDQRRSREAGFTQHVVKPINVDQLEQVIRRVAGAPAGT